MLILRVTDRYVNLGEVAGTVPIPSRLQLITSSYVAGVGSIVERTGNGLLPCLAANGAELDRSHQLQQMIDNAARRSVTIYVVADRMV
jgi:hypothetical protein